jgi:hypothetical protein
VKLLVMVVVLIALVCGGAGYAFRYVRDQADEAVHRAIDTQLPQRVQEHAWAPVVHGKPVRRDAIAFGAGTVETVRCHVTLGTYGLTVVHGFTFAASATRIPRGCPGALMRRELARASRATDATEGGRTTLTLTDAGDTVLTLRGVHG